MADPKCPVCNGDDCILADDDDDGDMICRNPECKAKFVWPQPPSTSEGVLVRLTPEQQAQLDLLNLPVEVIDGG